MLPGSLPGGREFTSALRQLLQGVQSCSLLGSGGLKVETEAAAAGGTGVGRQNTFSGELRHYCAATATQLVQKCTATTVPGMAHAFESLPDWNTKHACCSLSRDLQCRTGSASLTQPKTCCTTGLKDALMQIGSPGANTADGAAAAAAASLQPKQYSLGASWTTAREIRKLEAAAKAEAAAATGKQAVAPAATAAAGGKSASKPFPALAVLTSSAAQLLGLQDMINAPPAAAGAACGARHS